MARKMQSTKVRGNKKLRAILVPHTHWDREWYSPFQVFRTRLVKMMDNLLAILAKDPKFTCFTMDGQVAPIEDYLEVRPEREQELTKYIRDGRIAIGPAYIQPDNFLVSGEAHIRNLLLGMKLAQKYGKVMKVGYMPDAFGQIAQMPQILSGCGIDAAIFTRGMGDEGETLRSEFTWRAPDGITSVLTHWLVLHYANLKDVSTNMASALGYVARVIDMLKKKAATGNILLMNGNDHVEAQPHIPLVVQNVNRSNPETEVRIGSFADYFALVKAENPSLQVVEGEFRGSKYEAVLTGVTSTRTYLKQKNAEIEALLEQWAEPFDAWAWSLSGRHNQGLIWQAWKYAIQCHPHDSICGCGIDPVYDEMMTRFASAEQLAGAVLKNDLCLIASMIKLDPTDYAIVVFNPSGWSRTDAVETTILAKKSTDEFEIVDQDGKPVPFAVLQTRRIGRVYSSAYKEKVFDAAFLAKDVPSCGYKTYRVRWLSKKGTGMEGADLGESISSPHQADTIENEYFSVKAEKNGSITLTDKASAVTYSGFNTLEDGGDVGDEYNYDPPGEDKLYSSRNSTASVMLLENGPARSTLKTEYELPLPARATEDRRTRSSQLVPCRVRCLVSVSPGVPRVDFTLELDNNAGDHRLRVVFPTGITSDHANADQAFHVIKRPIAMPEGKNWLERPAPTHSMQSFVSLDDCEKGVTVATRGLMEYEVKQEGTIAVTLLRCVGMLSQEQLSTRPAAGPLIPTPGAQCLGKQIFNYSVIPHKGTWEESKAYLQSMQHRVPMRTVQVVDHEFAVLGEQAIVPGDFHEPVVKAGAPQVVSLPLELSFLTMEPDNILISAIKRSEDGSGIIIRVYNTTSKKVGGKVRASESIRGVIEVNMCEESEITTSKAMLAKSGNTQEVTFESLPFHVSTLKMMLFSPHRIRRNP
ncbi:MAG: glycoside hydrolase family 38 C-terminal domain-containing protein [Promethearchaeati archaeon SRVP18_Atabeyarchaeia-1]